MRNLPDELKAAFVAGDFHDFLRIKIDLLSGLHKLGQQDPRYRGIEVQQQIDMMKACDLAMWQMKEALGYPIPSSVDDRYPHKLGGNGGQNPFKCGLCDARRRNPDLFVPKQFEVRVASNDEVTAGRYIAAGFQKVGWDSAPINMQPHPGFDVYRSTECAA